MPTSRPTRRTSALALATLLTLYLVAPVNAARADEKPAVDFKRDIGPLLAGRCVRCHYPGNEKGDLSLATVADLLENGYVEPGNPDDSLLLELVSPGADGEAPQMPKDARPLSADEVALLRRWIEQGAKWPKDVILREPPRADAAWWSLQPLQQTQPPNPPDIPADWSRHAIDRFVFAALAKKGLRPNPPADRRTWLRRVTYDLTGLPPTPAELAAFEKDDAPGAYERVVARLLGSAAYGEQWGRHWLDVIRFGESTGFERNVIIDNLWPFRDYVIRSFNDDKPIDQLIREHLAGDVLAPHDPQVSIGTAFLVCGPYDNVGNQDPVQAAQIRANTIDEMIRATGEAFLGLTIGCARCHDHKFDPLTQADYYSLYATFAGVFHGARPMGTPEQVQQRRRKLEPLERQVKQLSDQRKQLYDTIVARAESRSKQLEAEWTRPPVDRRETTETFSPVIARFVRLTAEGRDTDPKARTGFGIDEFEIYSAGESPVNVALASRGAKATGASRQARDFADAYSPQLTIDGDFGARWIAAGPTLTIELPQPTRIDRVTFSSDRHGAAGNHPVAAFVCEYRIEVSTDGKQWTRVADSHDRRPVSPAHRRHRLVQATITAAERQSLRELDASLAELRRRIASVPPIPSWWAGQFRSAPGPFHVFLGGSPQRHGPEVRPRSIAVFAANVPPYELPSDSPESQRRLALARWITSRQNALTLRVLANRVWLGHFGQGIVNTPSDFGFMGEKPTHPQLLDWLAGELARNGWRLKPLHRQIVLSQTYRQSSSWRESAARIDADSRLLWRFPPRRLSAEELRDTILSIAGVLDRRMGGPGFRLYDYLQDNVATYVPRDSVGPETYRRSVYHQNARAARVDVLSDFDLPDCAFPAPRRRTTTTPLQALTMLNHSFTLDMARQLSERLRRQSGNDVNTGVAIAYQLAYGRTPDKAEQEKCAEFIHEFGWEAWCRVLLNTNELIYIR